jgi:putative aldouronate transport system permease protein
LQKSLRKRIKEHRLFYLMILPGFVCVLLFSYLPLAGLYMAFVSFVPKLGNFWPTLFSSKFVGFQWFSYFFSGNDFLIVMRNTLVSSVLTLLMGFIMPILLAIFLNECKNRPIRRIVQTTSYLPYFVSWVIASNIIVTMLSGTGLVNQVLIQLGFTNRGIPFLQEGKYFWAIISLANTWKEMGYNSIMYLAAISAIDTVLFEAAQVDGAGRFRQIWSILLPSIMPTVVILLILSIGRLLNTGFDQFFLLGNAMNRTYSDVIDTYSFRYGIQNGLYSYATAVGLFKSVVAFLLVLMSNSLAKKAGTAHLF